MVSSPPPVFDEARLAVGGFLAHYSGHARTGYASDLLGWCARVGREPFAGLWVHIELYARWMEEDRHLARTNHRPTSVVDHRPLLSLRRG